MEIPNLEDRPKREKMAKKNNVSKSILQAKKKRVNMKRLKNYFETKRNGIVHSNRKGKQIVCKNCKMENKAKLKPCNNCKEYMCKECIKAEADIKSTKKLRNPMLYICTRCLLVQKNRRLEPCPFLDIQNGPNSIKVNDNSEENINKFFEGNNINSLKNGCKLVQNKGMCESCKCIKDNILIIKSIFEILENAMNIYEINLFWNYYQTDNPINSFFNFPLQINLILCEDCFRDYVKKIEDCDKGFFGVNNFETMKSINFNEKEVFYQIKTFVNQFSKECCSYHLMFDSTLKEMLNKIIQGKNNEINNNEECSIENTLALNRINKKSIELVQQLKETIDNFMRISNQLNQSKQYLMLNYQLLNQQYSSFSQIQNQYQPNYSSGYSTNYAMNSSINHSNESLFNRPYL